MKLKLLIMTLFCTSAFASNITIYDTKSGTYLKYQEFINMLPSQGHIVMGEFHNMPSIQNLQAKIIKDKIEYESLEGSFLVHWEFLNYTDQNHIDSEFLKLFAGVINAEEFITNTAGKQNLAYAPIAKITSDLNGDIKGINLPREIKKKVMDDGINSVDPKYIPAHHYVGGDDYKERFIQAMGGHAPTQVVDKYFLAQCLTDSVMADQIAKEAHLFLNFTIAGSFHTDFFDGTVVRLKSLVNEAVVTLKIVSRTNSTQDELNYYLSSNPKYGYHSDYIIIAQ